MILVFFVLTLLVQQTPFVKTQKVPASGVNQAADRERKTDKPELRTCEFPQRNGNTIPIEYNITEYQCVSCKRRFRTLYRKRNYKITKDRICQNCINGILCGGQCVPVEKTGNSHTVLCTTSKAAIPDYDRGINNDGDDDDDSPSQIPLIIGFTVGGILLAIVVAGIFLGRQHKPDDSDGSEIVTTPVSLSNSEWHSVAGPGSARRREENLRVQEASTEDLTAVPMYAIQGYKKEYQKDENGNDFLLKPGEDGSSIGQDSYKSSDAPFYYPSHPFSEYTRSNRSSDVVLEDGYVPGGNFVGSADPQVQRLLNQNSRSSPNDNGGFEGLEGGGQNFFNGQTPGSMTHDTMFMSLTHSANNQGEVEYVIEDQDLVAFDTPASFQSHQRTPPMNGTPIFRNNDEDTMQFALEYRDLDSDFEESESRPNSAVKSDKSDVFFSSDTQSPDDKRERHRTTSSSSAARADSLFSESGIEVSSQSKESCEIIVNNGNVHSALRTSTSWNENGKGSYNKVALKDADKQKMHRFVPSATNRSKSCTWKSPSAPTRSCTRQKSVPVHCPSSEPAYTRPRTSNLTHVFVDVHRNMASSDEDLLAHTPSHGRTYRNPSVTDSECSFSEIPLSALKATPEHIPYDVQYPTSYSPATKLARKQRNKSMYVLRNGGVSKSQNWAPRTVRFSSGGSGEYAIPFGSLVP